MKRFILAAALVGGFFAFSATEASAVVCARGVYRAGCAGPRVVQWWGIEATMAVIVAE
jgi:hypothetical protein